MFDQILGRGREKNQIVYLAHSANFKIGTDHPLPDFAILTLNSHHTQVSNMDFVE